MKRRDIFKAFLGGFAGTRFLFSLDKTRSYLPFSKTKYSPDTDVVVKVLGTAQDGGIPHFGCYCTNCHQARKDRRFSRFISSLAILDLREKKFFLLDATPDIRVQSNIVYDRLNLNKKTYLKFAPDGVVLTHAHIGHYTGLMFFGYEAMSTSRLPVFCSSRMKSFLSENGPWSQLVIIENISLHPLSPDERFYLTPKISLTPFQVPHRDECTDTLGFLVSGEKRKLLYIPDIQSWEAWKRSIVDEVKKVDIALLDGTFCSPEELPGRDFSKIGHPFIQESMEILSRVARKGATKIYFTHLNHSNLALDPEGEARKKVEEEGFQLASEGMEFSL